jgi:coproporphyrinogen III oxidase-like Fe-S oxidoreductase
MLDVATARAVGLLPEGADDVARVRYANVASIADWLVGHGDSVEFLTEQEARREDVMLGMRLTRGVSMADVAAARLTRVMTSLGEDGLVEPEATPKDGVHWKTTRRGWLLGNQVFGRLWSGE